MACQDGTIPALQTTGRPRETVTVELPNPQGLRGHLRGVLRPIPARKDRAGIMVPARQGLVAAPARSERAVSPLRGLARRPGRLRAEDHRLLWVRDPAGAHAQHPDPVQSPL